MNTYTAMLKKSEREQKRKIKQWKIKAREQLEREAKKTSDAIHYKFMKEREEQIQAPIKAQEKANKIGSFLESYANQLNYREWLTLRDILHNNYFQIENDIKTGKITKEQYEHMQKISKRF